MLRRSRLISLILILILVSLSCNLPTTTIGDQNLPATTADGSDFFPRPTEGPYADFDFLPVLRQPGETAPTPTPDPERTLPPIRTSATTHNVQSGETLRIIAENYGVSLQAMIDANQLEDPNLLSVGQQVTVPPPIPADPAPDFKIIPDSELVNGPYNAQVDLPAYIAKRGGYLAGYGEEVDGEWMTGTQIVETVARNYSVNPRLLLAVIEYQSGWLTHPESEIRNPVYPAGNTESWRQGLYYQLAWVANTLNRGFYLWRVNGLGSFVTQDGVLIPASPRINAGTAGVHYMFAQVYNEADWRIVVSAQGFYRTYEQLYGNPFDWAVEPLVPAGLQQLTLQLPFEPGVRWIFSGGAHGGWDGGSAWAAIDFAPPKEELGCIQNDEWVVAMADGLIVYSDGGHVLQDLDGDGHQETGWTLFYMHIETRDRVAAGTYLHAGERVGHPSCEGGVSTGTHVHIARRYNGEWIAINSDIPFTLDGWTAVDTGSLYNGYLQKGDQIIEPCQCKNEENKIERP